MATSLRATGDVSPQCTVAAAHSWVEGEPARPWRAFITGILIPISGSSNKFDSRLRVCHVDYWAGVEVEALTEASKI